MPLSAGTRLGNYEIIGPLGAGGMGEVYRAKDLRLGRQVALKVLPESVATNRDRLDRFEREARTVAGLNHPNIVTLHSVEEADGVRFLTMELVEGRALSDEVAPGGLPLSRIVDLAIPLTDALAAAHERGVVHRDLKPANVMVTRDGRVKVLDFGLAKLAESEVPASDVAVTVPISGQGLVLGTVPYMAPEQLRGDAVDARTDLFALGVLLYELASGKRPFQGETSIDVSHAILRTAPQALKRDDLPQEFVALVNRCLEKSPRDRPPSAVEANNTLRQLRRQLERRSDEPASAEVATIAVLPFANRSGSADDEYFSDGLADELLNVLAKIQSLRVTARTSSFHFKGKDLTIAEIGKALNVATILEGSVRKAGNRVRISVQLVKVPEGYQLWSETYDRTLDDIFAVQDDIAQAVVKELRAKLLGKTPDSDASGQARAEVAQAARGRGADAEAHRLYLLARHLGNQLTRSENERASLQLKKALELDPGFAVAWAELSRVYFNAMTLDSTQFHRWLELARQAALRAIELEPDMGEGYARLGSVQVIESDFERAAESFNRALELSPGSAVVLRNAGSLETRIGHVEKGIEFLRRALEVDPVNPATYQYLGRAYEAAGRVIEAEAAYRGALEVAPRMLAVRGLIACLLSRQGRHEEALDEALEEVDEEFRLEALAIVHHAAGRSAESDAALGELIERFASQDAYQIAEVYGARGEIDRAFEWLEKAHEAGDGGLSDANLSPHLRRLRDDARWMPFLKAIGQSGGTP